MKIINLTPHTVNLPTGSIEPSGEVARVEMEEKELHGCSTPYGATFIWQETGEVENLPDPDWDEDNSPVLYLVSTQVRLACPERTDLASPARLVRDDSGRVVGAEALTINRPVHYKEW